MILKYRGCGTCYIFVLGVEKKHMHAEPVYFFLFWCEKKTIAFKDSLLVLSSGEWGRRKLCLVLLAECPNLI